MQHRLDLPPAARLTDPTTSKQAAENVSSTGVRAGQMYRVARLVRQHPGKTGNELAEIGELTERQISRRLSDASASGLIQPGDPRKCSVTGANARPWFPL